MARDRYGYEGGRRGEGFQARGERGWPYGNEDRRPFGGRDAGWGGAGGPGFSAAGRYDQAYSGAYDDDIYRDDYRRRDERRRAEDERYGRGGYGRMEQGWDPSIGGGRYYGGPGGWGGRGADYGDRFHDRGERGFMDRAADEVASWFGDDDANRRRESDHRGKGPRGYRRSDLRIEEDVNDRLTDDPMLDASDIEVSVADAEVTLAGEVDSRLAKRRAEDCADSVSGVGHVQNNLRVRNRTQTASTPGPH